MTHFDMRNKMVYVVYQTKLHAEWHCLVCAVTLDREVACQIADELEIKDGGEYWVDDVPVSHSLEEYKDSLLTQPNGAEQ